jgi:hypothetical protein
MPEFLCKEKIKNFYHEGKKKHEGFLTGGLIKNGCCPRFRRGEALSAKPKASL